MSEPMMQFNVVPKAQVQDALMEIASVLARCHSRVLARMAGLGQVIAVVERSEQALASIQNAQAFEAFDRSLFAGLGEANQLRSAMETLRSLSNQLGVAVDVLSRNER